MTAPFGFRVIVAAGLLLARIASGGDATHPQHLPVPATAHPVVDDRAALTLSPTAQVAIGLQTQAAARAALVRNIRTIGSVTTDQTRETKVHTRISGWIERVHADHVGQAIKKGDALYSLYSPDLISTQTEYLEASKYRGSGGEGEASALTRMRLWGVAESELQRLKASRSVLHAVTFFAPADGIVIRKAAVLGAYVTPETELYYLADISSVWLLLALYEADLSLIDVGDSVRVRLAYDATKYYTGTINHVFPELDTLTRTAKARVTIVNSDRFLRPGMFANVEIEKKLPEMLVVSADAVIDTGQRTIVFVKEGEGSLIPREVRIGTRVDGKVTILSGLREGEAVVVSASFLIDAESRIQAVLRKGGSAASSHREHNKQ